MGAGLLQVGYDLSSGLDSWNLRGMELRDGEGLCLLGDCELFRISPEFLLKNSAGIFLKDSKRLRAIRGDQLVFLFPDSLRDFLSLSSYSSPELLIRGRGLSSKFSNGCSGMVWLEIGSDAGGPKDVGITLL